MSLRLSVIITDHVLFETLCLSCRNLNVYTEGEFGATTLQLSRDQAVELMNRIEDALEDLDRARIEGEYEAGKAAEGHAGAHYEGQDAPHA